MEMTPQRKEEVMISKLEILGEYVSPVSHLCKLRYPVVRLSTGRTIMVGKHSYSSRITESFEEIPMSEYVPLTREEEDECWKLVGRYEEIVSLLPSR